MKKIGVLVSLLFVTTLFPSIYAQTDRTLSNGFSINLVTGFPDASFGAENGDDFSSDLQYGAMWGIQLGNRWYFNPKDNYGFGLMVNWVDFAFAGKRKSEDGYDLARATMDITLCELGPIGTFKINDDIAIDGYYNLRPTILTSGLVESGGDLTEDNAWGYAGFGLTNTLGAAFRWKVLNVGVEYVFGDVKAKGKYTGAFEDVDLDDAKLSTNSVRLVLGVKF